MVVGGLAVLVGVGGVGVVGQCWVLGGVVFCSCFSVCVVSWSRISYSLHSVPPYSWHT